MPKPTSLDEIIMDAYKTYEPEDLEEYKPTNADRIRAMSDEELAEHFSELIRDAKRQEYCTGVGDWLQWLQSEVEEQQ